MILLLNFRWLLVVHFRDEVDQWIEALVRQTKVSIVASRAIADGPLAAASEPLVSATSAASSSTGVALNSSSRDKRPHRVGGERLKLGDGAAASTRDKMLEICMGK